MEIVSINRHFPSQGIIPKFHLCNGSLDSVVDGIFDFLKEEGNAYDGDDMERDLPVLVRSAINKFQKTLLSRKLVKEFVVDEYFFRYAEEVICGILCQEYSQKKETLMIVS